MAVCCLMAEQFLVAVCCLMAEQFLVAVWLMASKATSVGQTYDNHVYLINIYIYILQLALYIYSTYACKVDVLRIKDNS